MDGVNETALLGSDVMDYDEKRRLRVFRGTNIPIMYLWNALMDNETIADFIQNYPEISETTAMDVVRSGAFYTEGRL